MNKKSNFQQRLTTVTKRATSFGRMSYFDMKETSAEFSSQKF